MWLEFLRVILLLLLRMEIKKISLHVKHLKIDSTIKKFLIIFQNNVSRHRNSMASYGSLKKCLRFFDFLLESVEHKEGRETSTFSF